MPKTMILVSAAALASGSLAFAAALAGEPATGAAASAEQPKVCKMVVGPERGAKPYEMCMTKAEWTAKKLADAKDPNRMVCQYVEHSGTRFRSSKVCMTAMQWEQQRLADRQALEQIQMQTCVPNAGC